MARDPASVPPSGVDLAPLLRRVRAGQAVAEADAAGLAELRSLGFEWVRDAEGRVRFTNEPDLIFADEVRSFLAPEDEAFWRVLTFQETASTSDVADRLARQGAPEGLAVLAEKQSAGRGRMQRVWHSRPGCGIWLSVLLRPELALAAAGRVTITTAAAVLRAVEGVTGLEAEIKWPNDLYFQGKKLAGILTEATARSGRVDYVIVGIGLNVNHLEVDLAPEIRGLATSLRMASGRVWRRAPLVAALLSELRLAAQAGGEHEARLLWERRCLTMGREVSAQDGQREIRGRAESVDEEGALLVRTDAGFLVPVRSGEVRLL